MSDRLLIATHNRHKVAEFAALFAGIDLTVESLADLASPPPAPEETGTSFAENALLKARVLGQGYPGFVLADDSGLVVPALGGEPGIHSARYAGPGADDAANRRRLIARLAERRLVRPAAHFVCCLALIAPDGSSRFFEGRWDGLIIAEERGAGGFGYDSLFLLTESGLTAAELPAEKKNAVSHRGRALARLREHLQARPPSA